MQDRRTGFWKIVLQWTEHSHLQFLLDSVQFVLVDQCAFLHLLVALELVLSFPKAQSVEKKTNEVYSLRNKPDINLSIIIYKILLFVQTVCAQTFILSL